MTGEAESLGELSRQLATLEKGLGKQIEGLHRRFDALSVVHRDTYESDRRGDELRHLSLAEKVTKLEERVDVKADAVDLDGLRATLRQLVFAVLTMALSIIGGLILAFAVR